MSFPERIPTRNLLRQWMIKILGSKRKKWTKLPFPAYCIQVEREFKPIRSLKADADPRLNASKGELLIGWMNPISQNIRMRMSRDLALVYDQLRRADLYARKYADAACHSHNQSAAGRFTQLYAIRHIVNEPAPQKKKSNRTIQVYYPFLQTVRGDYAVNTLDRYLSAVQDGLQNVRDRIPDCADRGITDVDAAIDEQIRQNQRIQNGRQP